MRKKNIAIMILTALTLSTTVQAAPTEELDEYSLDTVIVTATRTSESIKNVPANVTVITTKDLEKKQIFSVREALQNEVGFYLSPTAETKNGLSLRGFSGQDILVLYDGQQINSAFDGSIAWDSIPLNKIERIEIVRGAGSSLYGGHAVAGVINIIPKESTGETNVDMNVSYGSNNTWKRGINIDGAVNDDLSFNIGYQKRSTQGYRGYYKTASGKTTGSSSSTADLPTLGSGQYVIGGRGEKSKISEDYFVDFTYDIDDNRSVKYSYTHNNYNYAYNNPFSYIYDSAGNQIFKGTILTQDGNYVTIKPSDYLGYIGEREQDIHKINYRDDENQIKIGIGMTDLKKEGYSSADSSATSTDWDGKGSLASYPSKNYNFDFQKTWEFDKHNVIAGFAWMKEKMTYTSYGLTNWNDWNSISSLNSINSGSTHTLALFAQDQYTLSEQWKVYTGVRFDQYKKEGGYSYLASGNSRQDFPSKSFSEVSPKIAFEYTADDRTTYFTSYGHSFNPPSIYKLYRRAGTSMSSVQANPDLEPETSNTFELGMKRDLDDNTSLGITLFHVKTKDKIALATKNGVKAYYNLDNATAKGVELELKHKLNDNWSSYFNYTYERGENESNDQTTRNWDIPRHLLHTGIDYTYGKANWGLDAQYVSERQSPDADTGEYGSEDAFFLMNTYLNYKATDQIDLQFGIQNLLDRKFYASEATSGRTYTLSVNYSF